jgi:hypothetical protein
MHAWRRGMQQHAAPCMHGGAACSSSFMHAWRRGAARGYGYSSIIQLYRTLSSWRRRLALLLCSKQCTSRLVYVLQIIQKRGESPPRQEVFALSTGPLGPDLALQQIVSRPLMIRKPRSAPNWPAECAKTPHGRPLLDAPYVQVSAPLNREGHPGEHRPFWASIQILHTNVIRLLASSLARCMTENRFMKFM